MLTGSPLDRILMWWSLIKVSVLQHVGVLVNNSLVVYNSQIICQKQHEDVDEGSTTNNNTLGSRRNQGRWCLSLGWSIRVQLITLSIPLVDLPIYKVMATEYHFFLSSVLWVESRRRVWLKIFIFVYILNSHSLSNRWERLILSSSSTTNFFSL